MAPLGALGEGDYNPVGSFNDATHRLICGILACVKAIGVIAAAMLIALPGARLEAASEKRSPTLRIAAGHPLLLRGMRFVGDERVRVTVSSRGVRAVRRVKAGDAGRFTLRFPGVFVDRCSGLLALALGSEGSRASLKLAQLGCPPS